MTEFIIGNIFSGRYQIVKYLGKGGMGKVYKVFDKENETTLVLKVLKPTIASRRQTIERFLNEIKLTQKISHKNICNIYSLKKAGNTLFISMEYIPGENLKSILESIGQLSTKKIIHIAKQLCEGLYEAHGFGVVHRDLKPRNVMVDDDGNVKIMDFGIARAIKAKGVTDSGVMIGTPEYMSPEQAASEEIDQRSDIYSLGVILYELATGEVPFKGKNALKIALKHSIEKPPEPKNINSYISEDLNTLILKCLEKEKNRRYQSTKELLSDLINIEQRIPIKSKSRPRIKTLKLKLKNLLNLKR